MTTFKSFIAESLSVNDLINAIQKECGEFIKNSSPNRLLYRGMKLSKSEEVGFASPRTDRRPTDTSDIAHKKLDELFVKYFKFPYRSSGLFASPDINFAKFYGKPFVIFPTDGYTLLSSSQVVDLYTEIATTFQGAAIFREKESSRFLSTEDAKLYSRMIDDPHAFRESEVDKINEKIFIAMKYKTSQDMYALDRYSEMMVQCKKYYFVDANDKGWNTPLEQIINAVYK